jgi:hypothetical protein
MIKTNRLRMAARGAALGLAAFLAACATHPTPYQAAAGPNQFGYSEQQLEQNRFRVTFTGNSDTPRGWVENGLLYRAAEITKMNGYDYFVEVTRETEPTTRYQTTFDDFDTGFGFYHRHFGAGWGTSYGQSYPITRYSAYADIVMMKGRKDPNDVKAYGADDVMQKLSGSLYRGGPVPPKPMQP